MHSPVRPAPVYGIDLVRFAAASFVMLYHFSAKPFLVPEASSLKAVLGGVDPGAAPAHPLWWGWIGVQIFFVISGAVISFSAARASPAGFFVGRAARLWPALLICVAIIAVLNLGWWGHTPGREFGLALRSLLFWPPGPWVSGQIWTLPIEVAFYGLVWVMILARARHRLEVLAWVLGLASFSFWLLHAAGLVTTGGLQTWLLLQHGVYFALGVTVMAAGVGGLTPGRSVLAALCVVGAWLEVSSTTAREAPGLGFSPLMPFLVWAVTCLVIWGSVRASTRVARWIEPRAGLARTVRTIGLVTYPLYLVHLQPGGLIMAAALRAGVPGWAAVGCACLVAIVLATVIARLIEPPVHRAVKRLIEAALARGLRLRASPPPGSGEAGAPSAAS